MISWIQRSFQHHFKWLFLALLAVVIISFVFITNASSGFGHTAKQLPPRTFFGVNLNSQEEASTLFRDATLSVQLHGLPIRDQGQFQQYALQRHAGLHLARELNLPAPTEADLARHIQTLQMFSNEGKFDAKRYAQFVDSLKTNPQIKESDVRRVINDDVTYQQVLKLVSGPGYILPADVKTQLERFDASWTIETVVIDYTSYKPTIETTDADLSKFLEYNAARYEIATKAGVSYIDFPASAYTNGVTFSEEGLRAYYDANSARFAPTDEKAPKPASADAAFTAARKQAEAAYRLERAQSLAAKAAADFSVALYEAKATPASLQALLDSHKLSLKKVAPFNAESVPAELGASPQIAAQALKISADRPFSDPVSTGRGSAILVWNETIPARQPALTEIKDRVKADYVESEKRKRFVEAGRTLRTALEARLKAGDTLAKAVTASASVIPAKLSTKTWPAFTLSTPPQDIDYSVYGAIDGLQKGQLSQMIASAEQGFIVYAADKKITAVDETSPKFTQTRERLAINTASRNGSEYLARLVDAELAKTAPATP